VLCSFVRLAPEEGRADPNEVGTLLYGHLEVLRHSHGEMDKPRDLLAMTVADLAQRAEDGACLFGIR